MLFDFEPAAVVSEFGDDWQAVLGQITAKLKPVGKIRTGSQSIWPQFCKAVVSGAKFLAQFESANDFHAWVDSFNWDDRFRPALPMILSYEIDGIGFALACDFLEELGYLNFAKPDVHVREIFTGLGLCPPKCRDYDLLKAIIRVAKNNNKTAYDVDKLFWLIGSGRLYDDPHIGKKGKIGSHKREFIRQTAPALILNR